MVPLIQARITNRTQNTYQGKSVDLDINNLHLFVSHFTSLAFVLLISLQVWAEPLQLKGPIWIVTIIHLIQACNQNNLGKKKIDVSACFIRACCSAGIN